MISWVMRESARLMSVADITKRLCAAATETSLEPDPSTPGTKKGPVEGPLRVRGVLDADLVPLSASLGRIKEPAIVARPGASVNAPFMCGAASKTLVG